MNPSRQCVILAGGRGTRLGELTQDMPKPLLPVGGRPFVSYLIHEAARHGFRRIVLLAGFRADLFAEALPALRGAIPGAVEISLVAEPAPLGTGGALKLAASLLDDHFLLLNGDSLFDINLLDFAAPLPQPVVGRLALKPSADLSRYGAVALDGERITKFTEKGASTGTGMINGGIYWLRRSILDHIAEGFSSLETQVLPPLAEGRLLAGRMYDRFLLDIGIPQAFKAAQSSIPDWIRRPAVVFDRDEILVRAAGGPVSPKSESWTEGAVEAIKALNDGGYYVGVRTDESAESRSDRDALILHQGMSDQLALHGAHIDAFAKIADLLQSWPVRPEGSYLIGDSASDLRSATGLSALLFEGGNLAEFIGKKLAGNT